MCYVVYHQGMNADDCQEMDLDKFPNLRWESLLFVKDDFEKAVFMFLKKKCLIKINYDDFKNNPKGQLKAGKTYKIRRFGSYDKRAECCHNTFEIDHQL